MSINDSPGRGRFAAARPEFDDMVRGQLTDRRNLSSRDALVRRVLSEFREMPCLRVTREQAERLFGLSPDVTARVIETLMKEGHVRLDPDGRYGTTD